MKNFSDQRTTLATAEPECARFRAGEDIVRLTIGGVQADPLPSAGGVREFSERGERESNRRACESVRQIIPSPVGPYHLRSLVKVRKQKGQTLVIALIVLFVLLLIGFVFLGILNRNIVQSNTSQQRSLAEDLADAGIRYSQDQLQNNPLGADWRPAPTLPLTIENNAVPPHLYSYPSDPPPNNAVLYTTDPDEFWLRPAPLTKGSAAQPFGQPLHVGDAQIDMGGPDGLGPFSRVMFKNGRALVRVRYAPSDVDVTASSISYGPLRHPGVVHNYVII